MVIFLTPTNRLSIFLMELKGNSMKLFKSEDAYACCDVLAQRDRFVSLLMKSFRFCFLLKNSKFQMESKRISKLLKDLRSVHSIRYFSLNTVVLNAHEELSRAYYFFVFHFSNGIQKRLKASENSSKRTFNVIRCVA